MHAVKNPRTGPANENRIEPGLSLIGLLFFFFLLLLVSEEDFSSSGKKSSLTEERL